MPARLHDALEQFAAHDPVKARLVTHWHEEWKDASGVSMAHALVRMLRGIINFGAAIPAIPCTVSGLLAGDAGSVTCTSSTAYTVAGSYPVVPVVTPANPTNYNVAPVNGTLNVTLSLSPKVEDPAYRAVRFAEVATAV